MVTKPGLTKLNITPQSGSLNAMKASFASATRSQGISYGIMAQRSIFSTSALTNPKLAYGAAVANARAMLNAPRPMMFAGVMPHQCHNSGDDTMNKFMMGMMALNMVAEMTAGITKGIKDIKAARADRSEKKAPAEELKKKEVKENDSVTSSSVLSQMSNAKDSTALSAAIDKAIYDRDTNIPKEIGTVKEELTKLQSQTEGLEHTKNEKAQELSEHKQAIATKNQSIKGLTLKYELAQEEYNKLDNNSPLKIVKKNEMEQAKAAIDKAKMELSQLEAQTKTKEEAAQKAEDDYNQNLKDINAKEQEINNKEADLAKLKTEIPKQQKRLKELEEKDKKDLKGTNEDIEKLQEEINKLTDSKDATKKVEKQSKLDELKKKQTELKKRQAIAQEKNNTNVMTINGQQFKYVPSLDIYLINGKEVSKDFFEQQKEKYKQTQS